MLMGISVRYLNNDMIKKSENGGLESVVDLVTHKVLISDTTLRPFIPPQVRKTTPRLRHICGCEIWIITKDIYIDLNILRKKLYYIYNRSILRKKHKTFNLVLKVLRITMIKFSHMANVYMLQSNMQLNTSNVLLLNQII